MTTHWWTNLGRSGDDAIASSLKLVLTQRFEVCVLVDNAFGSVEFLERMRKLKYHVIVIAGVHCARKLEDGSSVAQLYI